MPKQTEKQMGIREEDDLARAQARSKARVSEFLAKLDPAIDRRDDVIASTIALENSSVRSKLGKVYALLSEVSQAADGFVACGKGCSSCCKMNVSVTSIEAERLASLTGRAMARVQHPVAHAQARFAGVPCPFLVNEECSVYEARPYACRAHFSFDDTAFWCHPDRAYVGGMGQLELGGAKEAYLHIAGCSSLRGFADIRDFFP